MSKLTKVVSTLLVIAAVVTFAVPAKAQTADELKAQVAQLQAALAALQSQLGGAVTTTPATSAYTFTKNLTVGSTGAEVSALQDFLASKGFLTATARGYFGLLTKAALAKYQASVGITPAAGYFGAITRAQINQAVVVVPPTSPAVSPSPAPSTTPTTGGISTPGVEAELTAEINSNPSNNVTIREGDQKASVMGLKLRAKKGDVLVQRVKLDLGTSTRIYNRVASNVYLADEAGNVIASSALNSSTVTKDGSDYYVTLSGFSYLVKKDETKNLLVKLDIEGSIDSTDRHSWTVKLPVSGIRYTDGANVISYAPSSELNRSYTLAVSEAEQATASFSKSANTPRSTAIVSDSTDNKIEKATILAVSVKAEKGDVKVTDLTVTSSGSVTPAAVYLYDGSTEVDSASASGTTFTFALSDSDYITIAKDATKTLTIKADYSSITATATPSTSTLALTSMTGENTLGDSVTVSGSNVLSDTMYLSSVSPVVALANTPSAVYTAPNFANSTGTMKATFSLQIKAEGNDVYIPKSAAFTVADATSGTSTTTSVAVDYQKPGSITELTNTYKIAKGETYTFDVNVSLPTAGKSGFHWFTVTGIKWDTTDTASATGNVNYLSDILKTNSVSITNG